jgi:hypothetical protein
LIRVRFVLLQNDVEVEKDVAGLHSERYPVSFQDADLVMSVKVEEVSDMQEEDVPVPTTWRAVKAESEVSCISVCLLLSRFEKYTELPVVFLICIYVSISLYT